MADIIHIASAVYPVTRFSTFAKWVEHTEAWVAQAADQQVQLAIFPEYGSMELISLDPDYQRLSLGDQVAGVYHWLDDYKTVFSHLARKYQVDIVAPSLPTIHGNQIFNTAFVFGKSGRVGHQHKHFMTRFEAEQWGLQAAPRAVSLFESDWGLFGVQICYDVEFPIGTAALCRAGAQVIAVPSCTETARGSHRVHIGARARALEQQCFTAVSALTGHAPWSPVVDINFGLSGFYATPDIGFPDDGVLSMGVPDPKGYWAFAELDLSLQARVRAEGQVLNFRDSQQIHYTHPFEVVRVKL